MYAALATGRAQESGPPGHFRDLEDLFIDLYKNGGPLAARHGPIRMRDTLD